MTTAMIMAMMTGCGSSDTAKDTQASTGSETSADSSAAESDYTIGISRLQSTVLLITAAKDSWKV